MNGPKDQLINASFMILRIILFFHFPRQGNSNQLVFVPVRSAIPSFNGNTKDNTNPKSSLSSRCCHVAMRKVFLCTQLDWPSGYIP